MGGASVFPGGRVDPTDGVEADAGWCDGLDRAEVATLTPAAALAHRIAAIRELFEEAGVLLAREPAGRHVAMTDPTDGRPFARWRRELHAGTISLRAIAETAGVRLALDALVPFARWVTPPIDVRQFDAWFFLARIPEAQTPLADDVETTQGRWLTPAEALSRGAAGELALPPPTWTTLRELEHFTSVDAATDWATRRVIMPRQPQLQVLHGDRYLVLPGDPLSSDAWHEPAMAETRFRLANGRWPAERAGA